MTRLLVLLVVAGCSSNNKAPEPQPDLAELSLPDLKLLPDLTSPAQVDADRSTVTVDRTGLIADGVEHAVITVVVLDTQGQPIANRLVTLSTNNQGQLSPASGNSDSSGQLTSQLSSLHVETDTIMVTVAQPGGATVTLSHQPQVAFVSLAPDRVVFVSQPADQTAGSPLGSVAVKVIDSLGNTVPHFTPSVGIAVGVNAAGTSMSGTLLLNTMMGQASFTDLEIDRAGSYTLVVSAMGNVIGASESNSFTIHPGAAGRLSFGSTPARATVGFAMQPVTVLVQDSFGNAVSSTLPITASIANDAAGGSTLGGTLTHAAVAGVATFNDLTIDQLGDGFTLKAHNSSTADALSPAINVRNSFVRINSGLNGGFVRALAIDPRNNSQLYAAVFSGGLAISSDAGASWSDAANGLNYDYLTSVVVDGKPNPSVVTAGTIGEAFRSSNGGASWTKITAGLPQAALTVMAIDPSPSPSPSPAVLYAGTSGGEVYMRPDDAASAFVAVTSTGLSGGSVTGLLVDSSHSPSTLFVSTQTGGVFTMASNGSSWTALPTTGLSVVSITAMAFDRSTNPYTIYAASFGDVMMMAENGTSWSSAGTGLTQNPQVVAVDSTLNPAVVYAGTNGGVFKLSGGGWSLSTAAFGGVASLALDATQPVPILYAGGLESGVFGSTNRGSGWGSLRNGMQHVAVHALALNTAGTILRAGVYGIYTSNNGGTSWFEDGSGADFVSVGSLLYSDRTASFFAASASDNIIYMRGAADSLWSAEGPGLPSASGVVGMTLDDVSSAQHLYVAGSGGTDRFYEAIVNNPWTTDTGPANLGLSMATDNRPSPPVIYLGTSNGVYSLVAGNYAPFSVTGLTDKHVNTLMVDTSTNPSTLVAGTNNGLFTAPTTGSWTARSALNNNTVYVLAVDSASANLYAGGQEGLARSVNHGATWTAAITGLGAGRASGFAPPIRALATDPANPATLYVGTEGTGVFKSISNGQ